MKKTVKLTFGKNPENENIFIKNEENQLGYSLNFDLGQTNEGIIFINGFNTNTENKMFVLGGDYYFENNGNTLNRNVSINDVDGEVIINNKRNGVLSNDITTFSLLIEIEQD